MVTPPLRGIWGEDERLGVPYFAEPGCYSVTRRACKAWNQAAETAHSRPPLNPYSNEAIMMAYFHEYSYEIYLKMLEWWLETRWGMSSDLQRRWSANPFLAFPSSQPLRR